MAISEEKREARRKAAMFMRKNFELEGIETPADVMELEERYIAGDLSEREFCQACIDMAKALAPNKDWDIKLPADLDDE